MRTVRRIFLFLLLLIFIVAVSPLIDGVLFKRSYLHLIEQNFQGKVQVQSYNQGYLSSTATLFVPFNAKDPSSGVTLEQVIYHGPYLVNPLTQERDFYKAAITTIGHINGDIQKLLGLGTDVLFQLTTVVSFSNQFHSESQSPAWFIKAGSQGKLVVQGMTGTIDADSAGNYFQHTVIDTKGAAITGESNGINLAMLPLTYHADIACPNATALCSARLDYTFPSIQASTAQGQSAKLSGLHVKLASENEGNTSDSTLQLSYNALTTSDFTTGAGTVKLAINGLNALELKNFFATIREIQNQAGSNVSAAQLSALAAANASLPKMITPTKTTFTEDFHLRTPQGDVASSGRIFWPTAASVNSAAELLLSAQAEAHFRASVTLVNQVIKFIDAKQAAAKEAAALATPSKPVEVVPPLIQVDETTLPAYKQFQDQINGLTANKVISPQIQIVIFKMSALHTPVRDFNNAVDAMLKSNQISLPVAKILSTGYQNFFMEDQKTILTAVFSTPASNLRDLKAKIESLVQMKVINETTAGNLIDLQQQSLSPEIYAVALSKFVQGEIISSELADQLKAQYGVINKDLSLNADATMNAALPAAAANTPPPVGALQQEFDDDLKQGLIKQERNDYVVDFSFKDGVMMFNGLPYKGAHTTY